MAIFYYKQTAGRGTYYLLDITHNAMMGALALTLFMFMIWEPVPESLNVKMALLVTLAVVGQGFMI